MVTIILGVVIGTYIFNFMVKDIKLIDTDIPLSRECISVSDKTCNYYFLQCGVYSTKENAVSFLDGCPLNEDCFIIEETGKYKVLCGLYNNNDICKKEEILNKSKIDSFKIKLDSGIAEQESRVKYELINGYIQIMDKVSENEVKSIKTNEFKEWAKKILENKGQLTEVEKELKEIKTIQRILRKQRHYLS